MTSNYNPFSLYSDTNQVTNLGITYLDFWNPPTIKVSATDTYITLPSRYERRPDLLSYDYYQTSGYWWVFMVRNPDVISDPINDFKAGINIFVPAKENLPRSVQ